MIRNAAALGTTPLRQAVLDAIEAGIAAARPGVALKRALSVAGPEVRVGEESYDLREYEDLLVLGGGNVAGAVVEPLEAAFGTASPVESRSGLVVADSGEPGEWIEFAPGDHPLPTERNVEATRALLSHAEAATAETLVVCVIGGGGSALLAAPVEAIPLADYRVTIERLLASGADIGAINTVRKHCSAIKGGRFARALAPATVVGLVFSDVVGDDLGTIASGPLWPDETTFADALAVLDRYDVDVPASVRAHLEAGAGGERAETPTAATGRFDHVDTHLVATADTAVNAAARCLDDAGFRAPVLSTRATGSAHRLGRQFAGLARGLRVEDGSNGVVCVAGGETTVRVEGEGTGGPSHAFALQGALELATAPPERAVVLGSVDTDGIDGASDAAGAIVDARTVGDIDDARAALRASDAGGYLADRGAHIETGPTGTNVNDLYVVGVGPGA